ncbi:Oxidoreductase, molybdopterin-binding domain-containing protein [Fusarium tricinctum]|uniref:Nitrate reductase [NADPH] n=1 Tax=Fusarium tricinctum TaxID=61284 RepID=A0A8K0S1M6_9HYPO|nr:Oxidoreductase, molybdopterin-binding domain-containing protein [Fusarium tricinctum]
MLSRSTQRMASQLRSRPLRSLPTPGPHASVRAQSRCFVTTRLSSSSSTKPPSPVQPAASPKYPNASVAILLAGAASLYLGYNFAQQPPTRCDALEGTSADSTDPSLPRYRITEVRKHDAHSDHPWVIHRDKVYDITEWIGAHPGGDVILRAAGGSIDPYWDIFSIHKNDYVYDILNQYLIGYVDPADLVNGRPAQEAIEDPFSDDPARHPDLVTMTEKPRNAETPANAMTNEFLTPNDLFYVRNHMWVPKVADNSNHHNLTIELPDGTIKEYTLGDLKTRFKPYKVTAALQCSGNRRRHMNDESGHKTNGLPWTTGAISNACWEGVLLSDVLADAGFDLHSGLTGESEAKHVQFSGLEAYGASIPLKKAIDPQGDVILAYRMNGQTLPRDHGFPLRAIVPGHVAARSVKWLNHVTLSDEESTSQWQRRDYKCFGPNQTQVDWDTAPAIQELPVQSAITTCKLGDWTAKDGDFKTYTKPASLTGYAYSGGGRSIIRVDISVDNGKTWSQASIIPDCSTKEGEQSPCFGHAAWAWRRWKFQGNVPLDAFQTIESGKRCATFVVKATDEAYNTQPESHAATWNLRGNLATAWHRVKICADSPNETSHGCVV